MRFFFWVVVVVVMAESGLRRRDREIEKGERREAKEWKEEEAE